MESLMKLTGSMKSKALFNFVLGLSIGLVIAFIGLTFTTGPTNLIKAGYRQMTLDKMADTATDMRIHTGDDDDDVITLEELAKVQKYIRPVEFKDEHAHHDEDEVAKALKEKVRVLCWIMTSPDNLKKKAVHVRKTWAHRCNVLVFISSETNPDFPTVGLNVSEGREHLTGKTMQAFRYMYEHYFDDADWFMKADDDTYVIMENLRYFLSGEDKNAPIYFGHHFKTIVKQGYFSGGAGYVLSKEALRRFANSGNDSSLCRQDGGAEDAELGHCMERLGIKAGNSTDFMGRSRFHCFDPETHLQGGYPDWYYKYDANGAKKGKESISDYAISFHYVPPQKMYALEFFIYHLRPYGLHMGNQDLNQNHKSGK